MRRLLSRTGAKALPGTVSPHLFMGLHCPVGYTSGAKLSCCLGVSAFVHEMRNALEGRGAKPMRVSLLLSLLHAHLNYVAKRLPQADCAVEVKTLRDLAGWKCLKCHSACTHCNP